MALGRQITCSTCSESEQDAIFRVKVIDGDVRIATLSRMVLHLIEKHAISHAMKIRIGIGTIIAVTLLKQTRN